MKLSEIYYKPQKKLFPVINEGFRFKYYAKINSLTCIVGKNGIGKTRFLNSILQNRAGVDLLFNDGTIKFGIEKSQTASPDIDIDRKSVRDIKEELLKLAQPDPKKTKKALKITLQLLSIHLQLNIVLLGKI